MKVENINEALRETFQEIINGGAKKRHVCALTLGCQNEPQFESFLKGNDFGIKPLQRLINNMGYNFNIIIIPQEEDGQITKFVEETNNEFLNTCKEYLVEKLGDENAIKSATVAKTGLIADISSELFETIVK
jgi:hypothetical protein